MNKKQGIGVVAIVIILAILIGGEYKLRAITKDNWTI